MILFVAIDKKDSVSYNVMHTVNNAKLISDELLKDINFAYRLDVNYIKDCINKYGSFYNELTDDIIFDTNFLTFDNKMRVLYHQRQQTINTAIEKYNRLTEITKILT
jgi:arginine utilization protein RocB